MRGALMMKKAGFSVSVALLLGAATGVANADPIRNPTAIFSGLDKTTGRIINFEVAIGESVQFGTLQVTPRVCKRSVVMLKDRQPRVRAVDELIGKPAGCSLHRDCPDTDLRRAAPANYQ